jgi:putative endonuclease
MKYFVYILRTSSNTLYTGQTNNLEKRLKEHKEKRGARYMKYFESFEFIYSESFKSRSEAMKRETELKKWPRKRKETLIKENKNPLS